MSESEKSEVVPAEVSPAEQPQQKTKALLPFKGGMTAMATVEDQYRLASLYVKSGILPSRFKTPEQVVVASHFAIEHFPEAPLTALRQIAVIEGVPQLFGDLPMAKVLKSGLLSAKDEYFVDKEGKRIDDANGNADAEAVAAVCVTTRKGAITLKTRFSIEDAKRAGLWDRATWKKYPRDMLLYRARARNLKSNFADCLNGVGIGEYDYGKTIQDVEAEVQGKSVADDLNERFLGGKEEA